MTKGWTGVHKEMVEGVSQERGEMTGGKKREVRGEAQRGREWRICFWDGQGREMLQ